MIVAPEQAAREIMEGVAKTKDHPSTSDSARAAWEGYKELCAYLAPILAEAYLRERTKLVWRRKYEFGQLPDDVLFQWRDEEDHGAALGYEMNLWAHMPYVQIACNAVTLEPEPVRLREVGE